MAFALDYGAVMAFGAARAVDMSLLSDVLPAVEAAIVDALAPDDGGNDHG